MKKLLLGLCLGLVATPALADEFPGEIIAQFYMSEFSTPKGWTLSYKGFESGQYVFVMDRDLDTFPQTGFLQPIDQLRRVMCGDNSLRQMVTQGAVLRVDARDKVGGKTRLTKGPLLKTCS